MKKGLVHIKKQYDPDTKEYYDIADLKIYYDSISGQYKHKFHCSECDKEVGCFCFDDIDSAVYTIEWEGINCEKCGVALSIADYLFEDEGMQDIIDKNECTDIKTKIMCIDMIHCGQLYPKASQEYKDRRLTEFELEIKEVTNNLSEKTLDEISSYLSENADWGDFGGSACTT